MKMGPAQWVKSSYSSPEGGNCLEWFPSTAQTTGVVPVRDSKEPAGPVLSFRPDSFAQFVAGVKAEEFLG
ncbi:DUF397 domain-containing protein [Streptomyces xiaopingdaonensis]|uniref:DUF397 domain-containing protein n=1 Tax=Streptomyces xiaopingdaonensis TaxID=1565415 RepID=UPI0003003496|nr:DUF397 domain-containing protein [Streptomyces xiaopingdaonensis]